MTAIDPIGLTPSGADSRDLYLRDQLMERRRLTMRLQDLEDVTVKGWQGGRDGGVHTARAARTRATALTAYIAAATAGGSRKHRTVRPWLRWLALLPLATDALIVVLYLSVVFNVRLDAPLETPFESLAAATLAGVVSFGLFLTLRWIAIRRRGFKNDAGRYEAADGASRWMSRAELFVVTALLAGAAMVMCVRVVSDAQAAGVQVGAVWIVAGFLALVTATLNWSLYLLEFADGSEETHELDHWGRQLMVVEAQRLAMQARLRDVETALATACE